MALIWHEKASRTALQTSSVQTHNMTIVKEIAEEFCKLSWIPKLEDKNLSFLKLGKIISHKGQ